MHRALFSATGACTATEAGNLSDEQKAARVSATRLYGRDDEMRELSQVVQGEHPSGVALLITGEPGIGKTVMLDAACRIADETRIRVVRATALEYEADLAFGGLSQIVAPTVEHVPELAAIHQTALSVISGLETGPLPGQLIAGAATLALLTAASRSSPLLVAIDDAHWLDRPSAMAIAYAARRLPGKDVRLLVSARPDSAGVFERGGFPSFRLAPLRDEVADEFLTNRFPALSPSARARILDVARGNPLGLLDLPIALEESSPRRLPDVLPLTERLKNLYARRLGELPMQTRDALLRLVLAGADGTRMRVAQQPLPRAESDVLHQAELAGIVRTDALSGRVEFRHPLMRAAMFEVSTGSERRRAHADLAIQFAHDAQRRAWHLGESASTPSEETAALLERVSDDLVRNGNASHALSALLRAAELTPTDDHRARRVARAAYLGSLVTGDLRDSAQLLLGAGGDTNSAPSLETVTAAAHTILNSEGDASSAHRLLIATLDTREGHLPADDAPTTEALETLMFVSFYAGNAHFWLDVRRQLARVRPEPPDTLDLFDRVFADPAHAGADALTRLDDTIGQLVFSADPVRITRIASAGAYVDRIHGARDALGRVINDAQGGGATARAIEALFLLANDEYFAGDWDALEAHTDEGIALCGQLGYALTEAPGRYVRALVWAARGQTTRAERTAEDLLLWAAPRGLQSLAGYASHILCARALALGDFEDAYRHATAISPAGVITPFRPTVLWTFYDLVHSAIHSGHHAEAAAHVDALLSTDVGALSPRLAMLLEASLALTSATDWTSHFDAALATAGAERFVVDRARIHLAFGERLRRELSPVDARPHLATALATFERLGAEPWSRRAEHELRAAGGAGTWSSGQSRLTAQETRIAELAATGLTNKDIAAQLFLSPRTVSTHLSRVFGKLGVGTRARLRDALDGSEELRDRSTSSDGF